MSVLLQRVCLAYAAWGVKGPSCKDNNQERYHMGCHSTAIRRSQFTLPYSERPCRYHTAAALANGIWSVTGVHTNSNQSSRYGGMPWWHNAHLRKDDMQATDSSRTSMV